MQIVYKKISELKEYENNPRNNEAAVEAVANSISEFGFKVPLVITKNNIIIAGHTRYKASHRLGLQEVPCIIADDLTEEQIKAFRLVENKTSELAAWDLEKFQVELEKLDLDMSHFDVNKKYITGIMKKSIKDSNKDNILLEKYTNFDFKGGSEMKKTYE